jgi:ABC-type multidrug transport system fused ATPase/permease subunit
MLGLSGWFRDFPDGLDTHLEMGEANLSSGEAQLIALVRLFLRKPGLVLLDEISSSMDTASEKRVITALEALCKGRTVLAIAHRAEALSWMDTVVHMRDGVLQTQ